MTPAAKPQPNPLLKWLPYLIGVITFFAGYSINALVGESTLAEQVRELTVTVNDMRGEISINHEKGMLFRQNTNARLDQLEVKVFGHIQQPGFVASANYVAAR